MYPDIEHRDFYPQLNGLSKNIKKDYLKTLGLRGPIKLHEAPLPPHHLLQVLKNLLENTYAIYELLFFLSLRYCVLDCWGVVRNAIG